MEFSAPPSDTTQKKGISTRRVLIIALIIIGGVIIGAGTAFYLTKGLGLHGTNQQGQGAAQSLTDSQAMISQANEQIANGQVSEASSAYDNAAAKATTDINKANIFLDKSIALGDAGHYQESLDAALSAEKLYDTSPDAVNAQKEIAKRYQQLGNTSQAIVYTNKVLASLQPSQSDYQYQKTLYEQQLVWLEGQK